MMVKWLKRGEGKEGMEVIKKKKGNRGGKGERF